MFWVVATRVQLDRWERLLAEAVWRSERQLPELAPAQIWEAEAAHHFALIGACHVLRALDLRRPPIAQFKRSYRAEIEETRGVLEHWTENMPVFNVSPRPHDPPHSSARRLADRHPDRRPFGWMRWSSQAGPMLTISVPAEVVRKLLDTIERRVAAEVPELWAAFIAPRGPSPWLGEDARKREYRWEPRDPDGCA